MILHEVKVRVDDAGGPVVEARETPAGRWLARPRIVLFVHGFNNTYGAALGSYQAALAKLAGMAAVTDPIAEDVCRFYWPGDVDLGWLSFISYPVEIEDAVDSAAELADFLRRVYAEDSDDASLTILAHSLGCRVVIEVVDRLRGEEWFGAALSRVCLMAAAVDVDTVAVGGPLHEAARFCAARGLTIVSSEGDRVLQYAFPLGSTLAEPGSGRALGRFGPPPGLAEVTCGWRIDTLDHGEYWPLEDALLRTVVADAIGMTAIEASPQGRVCPVHVIETPREVASRPTPDRAIEAP